MSAYQGSLSISCNGWNLAARLYNSLNKLVKAIGYCLPLLNNIMVKKDFLINNLLSKFAINKKGNNAKFLI